jgi:hypothetical protein
METLHARTPHAILVKHVQAVHRIVAVLLDRLVRMIFVFLQQPQHRLEDLVEQLLLQQLYHQSNLVLVMRLKQAVLMQAATGAMESVSQLIVV